MDILKAPFKGELSNSKLETKKSMIINCILACIFAIAVIASAKTLTSNLTPRMDILGISLDGMINTIVNKMLAKLFILLVVNFAAMVLVFSGIIYIISKVIFNLKISFEECLSICTYANIIPTAIFLLAVIISVFSSVLSIIAIIVQIFVLIILTYEGLSSVINVGKSKLINSVAVTYIVNILLFAAVNYLVIKSMIESSLQNLFY